MLRLLFCVLLLALLVPAPVSARGTGAQVADPENRTRAVAMLGGFWTDLEPLIGRLFNAQSACQKAAFDKAKAELLEQTNKEIELTKLSAYGESFLPRLIAFRDFIESLQYRDCPKPNIQQIVELARQRHAMSAFREPFGVIQLSGRTSGYIWLRGGAIGELFENLVFYQRICDEEKFQRLQAKVRSEIEARLSKDTSPTKDEALSALDKIVYVPCGKPKPQTATAGPPASGGKPEGSRTSGGTGQDATPTPSVTPGS